MTEAPVHPDPFWQAVCAFIRRHEIALARVIAPREFGPYLGETIPYEAAGAVPWNDVDCIVLHKGWLDRLPEHVLTSTLHTFVPTFANEVFVVYGRDFFAPMTSAEHIHAFLERLPSHVQQKARPENVRPLAVYAGRERVICRDVRFRKILTPARNIALIGAVMAGTDVVGDLSSAIAPVMAGAAKVVDYGGGIGLFALAAKEVMLPGASHIAIETDDSDMAALRANTELSGLFWRTIFLTSQPDRLSDLAAESEALTKREWIKAQPGRDMEADQMCDSLHIDLDLDIGTSVHDLGAFIAGNRITRVVLSRGLASRSASPTQSEADVKRELRDAGLVPVSGKSASFGTVQTWGQR